MPESYNPFLKMQNYFKDVIRAALTIFIVLFGYKTIFSGEMKMLKNDKGSLVLLLTKFSVVLFLIFYNGWQRGIYDYLIKFSMSGYTFVNSIFSSLMPNSRSTVLNLYDNVILKVIEYDDATSSEKDVTMCYRYGLMNDIEFRHRTETYGCGTGGFRSKPESEIYIKRNDNFPNQNENHLILSTNQEIEKLLYYIDKYNEENVTQFKLVAKKEGSDVWNENLAEVGLWNSNYDGCYFDTTEYPEGKEYLAFFDTFDCKMIRYLGYSIDSAVPNLFLYSLIFFIPQYFFPNLDGLNKVVSGLGSFMFGLMMTFAFVMFNFLVKAVYTFLSSFFMISFLIFLSPVVLPLMFFEKTKKIYESWYENILGLIFKPMFNLALLIMYLNIMDTFLLKDVTFGDHSNLGRDPSIICPSNSLSFYCIINKNIIGIVDIIKSILDNGLITLGINILLVFLFFKLGDSIIDELEKLIKGIFKIGSDGANVTGLGGIEGNKDGLGSSSGMSSAMSFGKEMDEFRDTYIRGGIIAGMGSVKGSISGVMQHARNKGGHPDPNLKDYGKAVKHAFEASDKINDLEKDIRGLNDDLRKAGTAEKRSKILSKIEKKASEIQKNQTKLNQAKAYMNEKIDVKDANGNVIDKKSRNEIMKDYENYTTRKAVGIDSFSLVRTIGTGLQHFYTKAPSTKLFKTSIRDKVETVSGWLSSKFHKEKITKDVKIGEDGKEKIERVITPAPTFFDKFILTRGIKKLGRNISTAYNSKKARKKSESIAEDKQLLSNLVEEYEILKKRLDKAKEKDNISEKEIKKLEEEIARRGEEILEIESDIKKRITKMDEYNRKVSENAIINDKVYGTSSTDEKDKKNNKKDEQKKKEEELEKKIEQQQKKMEEANKEEKETK